MRSSWLLLVMACGSAPPAEKPVEKPKPPTYTCATAADMMVQRMDLDPDRKMSARHDLESSCTTTKWPATYVACISTGSKACDDTRTPEQQADAQRVLALLKLPTECVHYILAIEALARCDKMPPSSRDAMKQGVDAMLTGWNFDDMPPETKKTAMDAAAGACKQGADAVAEGAKAAGC